MRGCGREILAEIEGSTALRGAQLHPDSSPRKQHSLPPPRTPRCTHTKGLIWDAQGRSQASEHRSELLGTAFALPQAPGSLQDGFCSAALYALAP